MKKLLVTIAAVLVSASTFGQGSLIFNNRTQVGDAPITRPGGAGAGAGITAQLYLVGAGNSLTPLTPTTTFRTGANPLLANYIVEINPFIVTGVLPGETATFRIRAWEGASYDTAAAGNGMLFGESNDVEVTLGGQPAVGAPIPTPSLNGLEAFVLQVPEPSTMALGLLGATALLFRRRK